jgi:hypothetical protein
MTTAITVLRSQLATALDNPGVWSVFSFPPASPIANSVVIYPDDPYIEPQNNQYSSISPMANFKISMIVPLFDNQGNLGDIETMAVAVMNLISASTLSMKVGQMSAPTTSSNDTGQMLISDLSVSILTTWS